MNVCKGTKLKNKQSKEVYYNLGKHLKQLHSIKITNNLRHQLPTVELDPYISFLESNKLDCTLLKQNKPNNISSSLCLIHGNLHTSNIVVSNNDVSGFIDLEEGAITHPEFDLASIVHDIIDINYNNVSNEYNKICSLYVNSFISGYGTQIEISYLRQWMQFLKYRNLCIFEYKNKKNI
jgi:aminoglycoside phosphotransferase (APT) family kinase protein